MIMQWANQFLQLVQAGGYVMPPLALAILVLWYAIGYRIAVLRRGNKRSVRILVDRYKKGYRRPARGIMDKAVVLGLITQNTVQHNLRDHLDDVLYDLQLDMHKYSRLIMTIVVAAPLTGLLGTVAGMIETFDSLVDANLFSQSGGIAGGISQALFTTQMGLVVAIPGLILGRSLDRKQQRMQTELAQLKDILCADHESKGTDKKETEK